jgi:hypothetical protein
VTKIEQITIVFCAACLNVALCFRNCCRFVEQDHASFVSEKRVGLQNTFLLIDAVEYILNLYRILAGMSVVMAQTITYRKFGKMHIFNSWLGLAASA